MCSMSQAPEAGLDADLEHAQPFTVGAAKSLIALLPAYVRENLGKQVPVLCSLAIHVKVVSPLCT